MRIHVFVADLFAANCAVVVDEESKQAVIIDPGLGVADQVLQFVADEEVEVVAICITHGHLDHVADVSKLAAHLNAPVFIGSGDAYRLTDPSQQLPSAFIQPFQQQWLSHGWTRPSMVEQVGEDDVVNLGNHMLQAIPAPGHTEGSTLWLLDTPAKFEGAFSTEAERVLFTGDVLFADSIGRTDLLGGNNKLMVESLEVFDELDPSLTVMAGHGPLTTVGTEVNENMHLRQARQMRNNFM